MNYFSLLKKLIWRGLRTAREHKVKTAVLLFGLYLAKKMFGLYKVIKNVYTGGDDLKLDIGDAAEESMRELRSALTMTELALEESANDRRDLEERVKHLVECGGGGGGAGGDVHKIDALVQELQAVSGTLRENVESCENVESRGGDRLVCPSLFGLRLVWF